MTRDLTHDYVLAAALLLVTALLLLAGAVGLGVDLSPASSPEHAAAAYAQWRVS